jgi:exosome complex RNA-binding protein Rrp42 (RNase PH superfamily)
MSRLTIAVNKNSSICCIQKGGHGSVSSTTLKSMIQTAQSIGKVIIDKQDIAIKEESKLNKEKIGFFL